VADATGVAGADVAGVRADAVAAAEAGGAGGAALGVLDVHADAPSVRPRPTAAAAILWAITECRFRFMTCPSSWRLIHINGDDAARRSVGGSRAVPG
jgi:hypothetical protein